MINATLADKMAAWAALRKGANALEADIKQEVLALEQTVAHARARATFNQGRKAYDYATIADRLGADQYEIHACSKWVTDWKKVCDVVGWPAAGDPNDDLRERYHKQARPSVTLKLLK